MIRVFWGIGVAAFVVYAAFSIVYLMSIKNTADSARASPKNTESDLNATLVELKGILEHLRTVRGDIGAVTEDVQEICGSVAAWKSAYGVCMIR